MRVTLRDIANRVNLSHATVSFVLNERMDVSIPPATRERVIRAAKEMGYRPNRAAQALVRGRTNMVALWLPLAQSAHYARAQLEFAALASRDGFELVTRLFDFTRSSESGSWQVDDWPVDGILMLDCFRPSIAGYEKPTGVPLVSLGAQFDPDYDHVGVDLAGGVHEAMSHLTAAGCRRIAYVCCEEPDSAEPKLGAYMSECKARKLEPELISTPACSRSSANSQVREYVAKVGPPHAILAQSDDLGLAAHRALVDGGLDVPKDVLLVGCDGSEEGECAVPSLTSITQPQAEMCARSWKVLKAKIAAARDEKAHEAPTIGRVHSEILPARLAIRESSIRIIQ